MAMVAPLRQRRQRRNSSNSLSTNYSSVLLASTSSFFLASGLALLAFAADQSARAAAGGVSASGSTLHGTFTTPYDDGDAQDGDGSSQAGGGVLASAAFFTVQRWAWCSALASAMGVIGTVLHHRQLIRVYAVGAAIDLVCTLVLLLVLTLLVSIPTLSTPFSYYVCSAITTGETYAYSTAGLMTMEQCESRWKWGMGAVILGALAACGLRAWSTALTWQHYGVVSRLAALREAREYGLGGDEAKEFAVAMSEQEDDEGDDGDETDTDATDGETAAADDVEQARALAAALSHHHKTSRRRLSDIRTERFRSSTLPMPIAMSSVSSASVTIPRGRYKSHSFSAASSSSSAAGRQPKLVLVPVFYEGDRRQSSSSNVTTGTPPRTRRDSSSSSSASSSASSASSSARRTSSSSRRPRQYLPPIEFSSFPPPVSSAICDEPDSIGVSPTTRSTQSRPDMRRGRSRSENGLIAPQPRYAHGYGHQPVRLESAEMDDLSGGCREEELSALGLNLGPPASAAAGTAAALAAAA